MNWFKKRTTSFKKDVLKLSFGTIAGRLIVVAALPIVTRLYSPEDFSLLATYLALVSILGVVACLRLDIAIPLAEGDDDAASLLALALLGVALITSLVLLVLHFFMHEKLAGWLGSPEIAPYLWLVPLGIAMAGTYSAFQYWATRARRFGSIARVRIGQAIAGVVTMLSLGWAAGGGWGLLLGNVVSISAGGLSLGLQAFRADRTKFRTLTLQRMTEALRKYHRYPVYSMPDALLNVAGIQVPILLIAAHGGKDAGFLLIAMQIMSTPLTLLGGSISQVYMSRAPQEYREGRLASFTLSIMRRLVMVSVGPLILMGVLAPIAVPWIFGAEWARVGEIMAWMVPWMALQFIASPVSMVMYVLGRQRTMFALTTFGAVMRIATVATATATATEAGFSIIAVFAGSSGVFYAICCAIFILAARTRPGKEVRR